MQLFGNAVLPTIADSLLSSEGFRNAVCLFINKQQAKIRAKEEAEEDFRKISDPQKESIRAALPRQESTVVKLIKAALVRLSEHNQQYFDSEEQLSKANQNKEYYDIPLCVLILSRPIWEGREGRRARIVLSVSGDWGAYPHDGMELKCPDG